MDIEKFRDEINKAISVEEMREADAYTIKHLVSGKTLMYRAAMGIYEALAWDGKRIAIVTGSGNNGGDGYALAEILSKNGFAPILFRVSERFSEDGLYYYERAKRLGVTEEKFCENTDFSGFDIVVDCILGTGFKGTPNGIAAVAIEKINSSEAFVVSADINSGLDGNTGAAELAVKSDLTVSVGFFKKGMFLREAPKLIGELVNVDIGIVMKEK